MQQVSSLLSVSTALLASRALAVPSIFPSASPPIRWGNCSDFDPPNLQCGQILLPIDYSDPDGLHFNLTFARLQTPDATNRLGSLFFNPGGPGASGVRWLNYQAEGIPVFSPELLAQYNIIGVDPRGLGLSNPVVCDESIGNRRVSNTPKNQEEFEQLVANNKAFSESCRDRTGPLFDFMGTPNSARDLDMVRQALQEDKLNYLGISFGTYLGSTYAGLYPENVGRMVLDGIMEPSIDSDTAVLAAESASYEATLNKFFEWCNTTSKCALHGRDAAGIFDDLIARANENPIPAPECNDVKCRTDVNGEEMLSAVQYGLRYVDHPTLFDGWVECSIAIEEAARGDASLLSAPMALTGIFSFYSTVCKDWAPSSKSFADLTLKRQVTGALSPHTKGSSATYDLQTFCIGWASPPAPERVLTPEQAAKLPKILLVNSFWDPLTSVGWANTLRLQMPSSVLILRNGAGHVSYLNRGEIAAAMDTFLLTGESPAQGAVFDS